MANRTSFTRSAPASSCRPLPRRSTRPERARSVVVLTFQNATSRRRPTLVFFLLAALAGCAAEPPPARNLILISIDTLRQDRLGVYGYGRPTSPELDRFAASGLVFLNAVSVTSWTTPAHMSMLSGLVPSSHGVIDIRTKARADMPLLSEILRDAGFRTRAWAGSEMVGSRFGFDRGFEAYDVKPNRPMAVALREAGAWLATLEPPERFFLFVHSYDVHCPYDPAPEYAELFHSIDAEPLETAGRCGNPHYNRMSLTEGQIRHVSDMYDASIREVDDALGAFFERLRASGRLDDTVVLVTSDHGEEFGEHGQIGHQRTLYQAALRIPLILVAPGLEPQRVVSSVGLVDVVPTVLDLLGVGTPPEVEGRSLLDLVTQDGATDPSTDYRISELDHAAHMRSVLSASRHLIVGTDPRRVELFRTDEDPLETTDVASSSPKDVAELRLVLDAYDRFHVREPAERAQAPDREEVERLRALGYVE